MPQGVNKLYVCVQVWSGKTEEFPEASTPLHVAAQHGDMGVVEVLLAHKGTSIVTDADVSHF